jgi:hypothetical protein
MGQQRPLDANLASDGIDELLEVLMPLFFKYAEFAGVGQTIRLDQNHGSERGVADHHRTGDDRVASSVR